MNRDLIKSIVLSKGWEDVIELFKKEFDNIKIDSKVGIDEIGKQYLAKEMAQETLNNVLIIINKIKNEELKKEIKYK